MKTFCGWGGVARPSRLRRSHTAGMQSKVHPTYKTIWSDRLAIVPSECVSTREAGRRHRDWIYCASACPANNRFPELARVTVIAIP